MEDGSSWPKVSIVTPSLNQAEFIEETIRSVLLQGYPNLEYLVIDGGSTDGSIEIIQKYAPWLAYWVSETDRGQSEAINKGFQHSTGEIMAWLNSDDIYYPNALGTAASSLLQSESEILIGSKNKVRVQEGQSQFVSRASPHSGPSIHAFPIFSNGRVENFQFIQSSMFWRRSIWRKTGELDERYHYSMDREWCLRALANGAALLTSEYVLSRMALHIGSKTEEHEVDFVIERALMYSRFSRMHGFRMIPCLLDSFLHRLRYLQDSSYARHDALRKNDKNGKAFFVLLGARLLRRARLAMNYLAQFQRAMVAPRSVPR